MEGAPIMFRKIPSLPQRASFARRPVLRVEELEERSVPTLLGQRLFPADNAWNQRVSNAPTAADSNAIINFIVQNNGNVNGQLHPDFGQRYGDSSDLYGIPYNIVHANSQPRVHVVIDAYASESDLQNAPIPNNVILEGDYQNGPKAGVNNRGDSHLLVWDQDNNVLYEFARASRPGENPSDHLWHADQETVWDLKTNTFRTLGWTSADAAGLAILPGLARPDEGLPVNEGGQGVINHAIRFTLQNSVILNQFLYPASHTANPGNNNAAVMPPMGARFRLKAGVDISSLNPESRIIAKAMKDYGMIVADNGSSFFFSGASSSFDPNTNTALTWNDNDIQDRAHGLKSLHFSDFEVVNLTPVVTGLSTRSAAAGTIVTVAGQNFSGAAGQLHVLFGNTPATSVTVVDDGHVTATVPAGAGTVNVRVQSGVGDPNDASNVNSPIFGYGISAITASDHFTYNSGGTTNAAPTVATAASASPNPVSGTTTNLSVLGADDGGEASLTYSWTVLAEPAGAHPVFSVNGTNAAKNTTVTFDAAGNYQFQATITDAGGLSASSSVIVTVDAAPPRNAPPTVAEGASASPNPVSDTTTDLRVLGADDGGERNLTYTWTVASAPGGANPTFSGNGGNSGKNTTVTFDQAGIYQFQVTIADAGGLSVQSRVGVTVSPTVSRIEVSPEPATVAPRGRVQFTATAFDQFGDALENQPTLNWSLLSGRGKINPSGLYTAPKRGQGTAIVLARAGGIEATAMVRITIHRRHSRASHRGIPAPRSAWEGLPPALSDPFQATLQARSGG